MEGFVGTPQKLVLDRQTISRGAVSRTVGLGEIGHTNSSTSSKQTTNLPRNYAKDYSNVSVPTKVWKPLDTEIRGTILEGDGHATTTTASNNPASVDPIASYIFGGMRQHSKNNDRTPQMLRRLLSGGGTGSNDLSGGELPTQFNGKETNQAQLPIYAPITPKIEPSTVGNVLLHSDDKVAAKLAFDWLTSADLHTAVLRSIPTHKRQRFPTTIPDEDLKSILAAGILAPASNRPSRAFCRLGFVPELSKYRRRIILEPRDLNKCVTSNFLIKVNLPQLSDIAELTVFDKIEAVDFKSFYYQIPIAEDVRQFYRVELNGGLYEVAKLPQGARHAVGVAQIIARAATKLACGNRLPPKLLVYIDNIFIPHAARDPDTFAEKLQPFTVGSAKTSVITTVLGVEVNCGTKLLSVKQSIVEKLGELSKTFSEWTARDVLKVFGLANFVLRVLHRPWSMFISQLKLLSTLCSKFFALNLDDKYDLKPPMQQALLHMINRCQTFGPCKGVTKEKEGRTTLITDASLAGWACIIVGVDGAAEVIAGEWKPWEEPWSINRKELNAIGKGLKHLEKEYGGAPVDLITDSRVAIQSLNKGHSLTALNTEVAEILEHKRKIFASWVASENNPADEPSRYPLEFNGKKGRYDKQARESLTHSTTRLWFDGNWNT